tara:strand:- start:664 stop:1113 length:450 start_codon:yes stop_codon:yes gene_type:complete
MLSTDNKMLFRGKQNVIVPLTNCLETKGIKQLKEQRIEQLISDTVDYLNNKTGKNFLKTTKETINNIRNRLKENDYKFEDFKYVIDVKYSEWINNIKYCNFIQPSTLFGNKFNQYLNQSVNKLNDHLSNGDISSVTANNLKIMQEWINE